MKVVVNCFLKDATVQKKIEFTDLKSAYDKIDELVKGGRMDIDGLISIAEYQ